MLRSYLVATMFGKVELDYLTGNENDRGNTRLTNPTSIQNGLVTVIVNFAKLDFTQSWWFLEIVG